MYEYMYANLRYVTVFVFTYTQAGFIIFQSTSTNAPVIRALMATALMTSIISHVRVIPATKEHYVKVSKKCRQCLLFEYADFVVKPGFWLSAEHVSRI